MRELVNPPGQPTHDTVPATQAPVPHDRSFLVASHEHWQRLGSVPGVIVPVTADFKPMSPIEKSTGVVLPIVSDVHGGDTNRHHGHFYKSVYESGGLGRKAVRSSRLQRVVVGPHTRYHRLFEGTELPYTAEAQYRLIILNCAGYVPDKGVLINDIGAARIVQLTHPQRKALRRPNIFTIERGNPAQMDRTHFLMDYALSQNFGPEKQEDIKRFLDITPEAMRLHQGLRAKKLQLAMRLTNIAIAEAVRPLSGEFKRAREQRALRVDAPETAWHVAKLQIRHREPDYFETLESNLLIQQQSAA
ncbi:MAG: hypothetical protein QFB86_04130 [Patescibacteria group bacterium]|nr:hypothetical protein [Patescibacteria group bacterium]